MRFFLGGYLLLAIYRTSAGTNERVSFARCFADLVAWRVAVAGLPCTAISYIADTSNNVIRVLDIEAGMFSSAPITRHSCARIH